MFLCFLPAVTVAAAKSLKKDERGESTCYPSGNHAFSKVRKLSDNDYVVFMLRFIS